MTMLLAVLENGLHILWRISWQASVLATLVFAVTLIVRLPARVRCILWTLVLLRLVLPVLPQSRWSVFNILGAAKSTSPVQLAPKALSLAPHANTPSPAEPAIEVHWSSAATNQPNATPAIESTPTHMATVVPSGAIFTWWQILALIWTVGALLMLAFTVVASLRLRGMLKNLRPIYDTAPQSLLASCAQELSVRRQIPLYVSDSLDSPALVGLWRPRLVLPASLSAEFSPAELRLVFLHELTHYKRCDIPLNYLLALLRAAHWFNPILHLFFNRWHNDRELACDEAVMARLEDPRSYGQTILKLLQALAGPRRATMPGVVGILESRSLMKRRMAMIASFHPRSRWMALSCVVLFTGVGCVAMTDAVSADNGQQNQKKADDSAVLEVQMKAADAQGQKVAAEQDAIKVLQQSIDALKESSATPQSKAEIAKMAAQLKDVEAQQQASKMELQKAERMLQDANKHLLAQASPPAKAAPSPTARPSKPQTINGPQMSVGELNGHIQAALDQPMGFSSDNTPVEEVLRYFADHMDVNMAVDWPALGRAGVEKGTPISLKVEKPVPARKLLQLVLHQAGNQLTFGVDNGILEITTGDEQASQLSLHVYPINDLLEVNGNAADAITQQGKELVYLIQHTVAPTHWMESGGPGSAMIFNGKLVLKTTPAIDEQVSQLLKVLREESKAK